MPTWAKHMYDKLCKTDAKQDEVNAQNREFITNLDFIDHKLEDLDNNNSHMTKQLKDLTETVTILSHENTALKVKVTELENYSKKYNIKMFNVEESQREDTSILKQMFADILLAMDLRLDNIYLDKYIGCHITIEDQDC